MSKLLLSAHVLAAIVFIGPVTMAVSLFPRYAAQALDDHRSSAEPVTRLLHRISRVYSVLGLAVPCSVSPSRSGCVCWATSGCWRRSSSR